MDAQHISAARQVSEFLRHPAAAQALAEIADQVEDGFLNGDSRALLAAAQASGLVADQFIKIVEILSGLVEQQQIDAEEINRLAAMFDAPAYEQAAVEVADVAVVEPLMLSAEDLALLATIAVNERVAIWYPDAGLVPATVTDVDRLEGVVEITTDDTWTVGLYPIDLIRACKASGTLYI